MIICQFPNAKYITYGIILPINILDTRPINILDTRPINILDTRPINILDTRPINNKISFVIDIDDFVIIVLVINSIY